MSVFKKSVLAVASVAALCSFAGVSGKSCKAPAKPVKLLYLGDSLADFDRGSNHVDKLQALLDVKWPKKVEIRNFAIRGDYIERMMDRMNGKKRTYALARYEGIWDASHDWAFVCLGHNDTRAYSDADFTDPLMSEDKVRSGFTALIAMLKSKGIKRIILRSAASCNFDATRLNTEKRLAAMKAGKVKKRNVARFGDPRLLEAFNAVIKELAAADPAVEYFDIYTDMKSHPDKASLFRKDGVHLSQKGHEYVAAKEFDYLVGGCPAR